MCTSFFKRMKDSEYNIVNIVCDIMKTIRDVLSIVNDFVALPVLTTLLNFFDKLFPYKTDNNNYSQY